MIKGNCLLIVTLLLHALYHTYQFISIHYIKAYFVLNILRNEAGKLFQYLRDKKKLVGKKVSASSTDKVTWKLKWKLQECIHF